jgi:hypothetical protein
VRVNGNFNTGTVTYTTTNRISINVCGGNFGGAITLNNPLSTLTVAPSRTYSGSIAVTNGSVTNNGTISNTVTLSNSSTYTNSGTQSGAVNVNTTGGTGYVNIGTQSGNVTLNGSAAIYTITPTGVQNGGAVTVTNGSVINSGTNSRDITLSNSSTYSNSGVHNGNVILNSALSSFNNSGTQSGELTLNGSLTNSGTLNLSSLTINESSLGITNTTSGIISLNQNSDLSLNAPFNNAGSFSFTTNNRNFLIASGVIVTNTGTFSVRRDFLNKGTFNSSGGTLTVGRDILNDEDATLNLGNTTVTRNFENDGLITLAGSLEISSDLINSNNNDSEIRPFNTAQCNTIRVDGDFENDKGIITGSNLTGPFRAPLIVNKIPEDDGLTGGAIVDPNLDCSCGSTFTNSGSFIVPAGVTQITMKAWGGGGKGGDRDKNAGRSGGGGAGAYSESTLTVTPGETLYYLSGAGSTTTDPGGESWVSRASDGSNPILLAKGGLSVPNNDEVGALGGNKLQGVGTGTSGGNGSDGGGNGGDGGDSPNGGSGGPGANSNNSAGSAGDSPGGGGGGAKTNNNGNTRNGGFGGNGQVTFSYSCEESVDPPGGGCWRYIDDGTSSGVVIIEFFKDCTWDAPQGLLEFEVLAIGGGGGGGVRSGGGGGGGGLVHARANISTRFPFGLPASSTFDILIGEGGNGSTSRNQRGGSGGSTSFDLTGDYEVISGGGGGGGSDHNSGNDSNRSGSNGSVSSFKTETAGFINVGSRLFGGSGGGAGHGSNSPGIGNSNGKNGGRADKHAGGGGGGAASVGNQADKEKDGGDGGAGLIISEFDNRIYSAGGGGGSMNDDEPERGYGGTNLRGGNGGYDEGGSAIQGEDGTTPGSGGGGGGHDENIGGGRGAKGVVIVRYEIARILPVEYLYFKADFNSFLRSGELSWATAQEWENSHFEIERFVNNVKDWELIGQMDGAGYSDRPVEYEFQDLNLPLAGGNIFYRLKQVDLKGQFTYSITKAIQVSPLAGTTNWRVYPNPTTGDFINLEMLDKEAFRDEKITVRVISVKGQSDLIEAYSPAQLSGELSNALSGKSAGVYTLEITWGKKKEYHKVILNR